MKKKYTFDTNTLPDFKSLNELVEFFDTNDLGEYWDAMPECNFEVAIKMTEITVNRKEG